MRRDCPKRQAPDARRCCFAGASATISTPEAESGKRTAYFVFDLKDPTLIPSVAEPFFMAHNAWIEMTPVMDLEGMKAGVEKAMKR